MCIFVIASACMWRLIRICAIVIRILSVSVFVPVPVRLCVCVCHLPCGDVVLGRVSCGVDFNMEGVAEWEFMQKLILLLDCADCSNALMTRMGSGIQLSRCHGLLVCISVTRQSRAVIDLATARTCDTAYLECVSRAHHHIISKAVDVSRSLCGVCIACTPNKSSSGCCEHDRICCALFFSSKMMCCDFTSD